MSANKPSGDVAPMAPPPPPPTLSFVPPQIRNWTPPPPSPRPPMAMNRPFLGPPRHFAPGPYHPGPNAGPYPPGPSQMPGMPPHMAPPGGLMVPVTTQQDHVIDKPKVVYSAAPVRLHPKKGKVKKPKTAVPAVSTVTEVVSEIKADVIDRGLAGVAVPTGPVTTEEECDLMEADEAVGGKKAKKDKKKKFIRTAAGETWEDASLEEWETDDFRIFCGDLGNEVTDECLARAFSKYPTFLKAKVVRDKRSNKTKRYGFVSFTDPTDFVRAMREMNEK